MAPEIFDPYKRANSAPKAVAAEDIYDGGGGGGTKIIIFMNNIQARDK